MIQRIGRVGRRQGKPGLIVLNLSARPIDRWISKNVVTAFQFDVSRPVPIPMNIEMQKLKNIAAIHDEIKWYKSSGYWKCQYTNYGNDVMDSLEKHFGERLKKKEAQQRLSNRYGNIIDFDSRFWTHSGFRASASQRKIPVKMIDPPNDEVGLIEDVNIFRDVHPEGIYLDAHGRRWRVKKYDGKWKQDIWSHKDSKIELAKYLKSIDVVYVEKEKNLVTTRGSWDESFEFYQNFSNLVAGIHLPIEGEIEYGIWEYAKKFNGYSEIDLSTRKSQKVTLAQVSKRFKNAVVHCNISF